MKERTKKLLLSSLILLASLDLSAKIMYVNSKKANILEEKKIKSTIIYTAIQGETVDMISKSGIWYSVKVDTKNGIKKGWMSKFFLRSTPPNKSVNVIFKKHKKSLKDTRKRAYAVTTAAAARGLASRSRAISVSKVKADIDGVKYMENISSNISDQSIEQFNQEIVK